MLKITLAAAQVSSDARKEETSGMLWPGHRASSALMVHEGGEKSNSCLFLHKDLGYL